MRRRVTIVQRVLTHYRVPFFEALRSRLEVDDILLDVVHGQPEHAESARGDQGGLAWARSVPNRYVRLGDRSLCWQPLLREVHGSDLVIVEQASRLLVNYVLLAWHVAGGPKVAFWGHGKNLDAARASRAGELVKRRVASFADWWFCYTDETARIVEGFGVPRDRMTVVHNAVDTTAVQRWRGELSAADMAATRRELGIGAGPVGLVLGSLYPAKRTQFVIETADRIHARLPEFHLVVIGDGPDRPLVDCAAATRPWVHPLGARTGAEMVRAAALGSVMLNPGLVGLAVVDSFALRVPMLTCDLPYHGPEFAYLEHGENGLVLPAATTPVDYAEAALELLTRPHELDRLRAGCAAAAERYTLTAMVDRFAGGVRAALGLEEEPARQPFGHGSAN